jgi:hypothetical protein
LFTNSANCVPQEYIRDVFKEAFQISKDEDFLSHGVPMAQQLEDFMDGSGPGPDASDLHWDFNSSVGSPWNQMVIHILMDKLEVMLICEGSTIQSRSQEYWKDAISKRFNHARHCWKQGKPRVGDNDIVKTPEDIVARLTQDQTETLMKARKDM